MPKALRERKENGVPLRQGHLSKRLGYLRRRLCRKEVGYSVQVFVDCATLCFPGTADYKEVNNDEWQEHNAMNYNE